jgi:hypothetical protein
MVLKSECRPLGRPRRKREGNTKMDFRDIIPKIAVWIQMLRISFIFGFFKAGKNFGVS